MKRTLMMVAVLAVFVTLLSGCATDIMQSYVGRSPEAVMARYGPPDNVFDMPDGRRAFQWVQVTQSTSTATEESRTRWDDRRHGRERVTTRQTTPAVSETHKCYYTLYATLSPENIWIFNSFEEPEFGC